MQIKDLFVSKVTRDIPPVVYFHEQTPEKLADEVKEYIVTGGWPSDHPNFKRVPYGIHEQYVRLLNAISTELEKKPGPSLPTVWISGFYGSGKSSFAKLLGLALDGIALPNGKSLAEAWLARDTSKKKQELNDAWQRLRQKVDPIAVVFDVGSIARDNEHVHSAAIRQLQSRLGYCTADPAVAEFELKLERDGEYENFLEIAKSTLGKTWDEVKTKSLADEEFSLVLSKFDDKKYTSPMSWMMSHGGKTGPGKAPEDAVNDIRDMLKFRRPNATLFMVIDEVSQYVHENRDRQDRLRAFASALGATLKGKAWMLALGQQKLDEESGSSTLIWARDRFPPNLRVDLAPTNIRDVVHKRLLQKTVDGEKELRALFDKHRPELKLYAYGCTDVSAEEFVEVYPMLPGHIDLLLQITSALRARSSRSQGDDQAIRGLLQLLGELFREQKLADESVGHLVTLDKIYEIQHTALDSDTQSSMSRIMNECSSETSDLKIRVAKVVSLLELIQENEPTTADLVARCLYDRLDRGNQVSEITEALDWLKNKNLLGYSEKQGYKIQSTAGEEWERTKRDIGASREVVSELVVDALKFLLAGAEKPKLKDRPFPLGAAFSDGRQMKDEKVADPKDDASVLIDFRFLPAEDRAESDWRNRTKDETIFKDRLVWVCGDTEQVSQRARELCRSQGMVKKYENRRESLTAAKKLLLQSEEIKAEELVGKLKEAVDEAWKSGKFYFQGERYEGGGSFATAVTKVSTAILGTLFQHFDATTITPSELEQLLLPELSGPSVKFMEDFLGILEVDGGRYVPACSGLIPRRVQEFIEKEDGVSGATLLQNFGRPPYGYRPEVIKACVAGLLRGSKIKVQPSDAGEEITAIRDAGVADLFTKDRDFKRADYFPAGEDDVGYSSRARICRFLAEELKITIDTEDHHIADTVAAVFPVQAKRLRDVLNQLNALPNHREPPAVFKKLQNALEACTKNIRQTKATVLAVKKHIDALRDGIQLLNLYESELDDDSVKAVRRLASLQQFQTAQLQEAGVLIGDLVAASDQIDAQLKSDRPWREIASLDNDVQTISSAYREARRQTLSWQGSQCEEAGGRVKLRPDFGKLTADQSHSVLRILENAMDNTTEEAIAPKLIDLRDPFTLRLQRAEEQANDKLDEILSEGDKPMVRKVPLNLHNREINNQADIDRLIDEIRKSLMEQLASGVRIRIT